jgi:transcription initiation factor TFIIE subunit alpha
MSEHKKLVRMAARAFYRHSSAKERLARTGNAKYDNSAIALVLVDALTRRTWVKEDDLARAVLLSAKQVRKALLYLEEQRLVTRAHVKEKDKDREARTRQRALENGVDEGIIAERVANIERKTVTYVCLNYSRIVDALTLRIGTARADLKHRVERGPISVLFRCTSDPEVCGKRYSSLDAARLLDPATMQFVCQVCKGEVVQLGGGEDGAPPEPRTREGMKAIWDKFERQMAPVQKQLDRVRGIVPPQYGSLNEWTRARKKAAERALNGGAGAGGAGGGGRSGGLGVQLDALEETKFEVTLGLTEEQEAAMEAEANAPKAQPEWVTRNQFEALDRAAGGAGAAGEGGGAGDDAAAAAAKEAAATEEKIKEEWLRAYLGALKGAHEAGPEADEGGGGAAGAATTTTTTAVEAPAAIATDDLVAEAMAVEGGDDEWEDVEDDWEDA